MQLFYRTEVFCWLSSPRKYTINSADLDTLLQDYIFGHTHKNLNNQQTRAVPRLCVLSKANKFSLDHAGTDTLDQEG